MYGLSLGCTVNADGEINPMGLADTNLTGPKLIPKGRQLGDYVPFNVQEASIYVNGEASSYESLKSCISQQLCGDLLQSEGENHLGLCGG